MHKKVILLVEDNPDDIALTMRAFKKGNVCNKLVLTCDGEQAPDYIHGTGMYPGRDPKRMPAVVLLDLKLPKIDGLEVLKRIRADRRTRLLPVVILTSSQQEQDLIDGHKLRPNRYILKPVGFENFCSAVQKPGMYCLLLSQPPPSPEE